MLHSTNVEEKRGPDSLFAKTDPHFLLSHLGFEDLMDWSDDIVLETALSLLATPSTLLYTCHNSEELSSAYLAIIKQFGVSHHEKTLYIYVQTLFSYDDTVYLCLNVTTRDTNGLFS
ncbi:hypothetical protein DSO57_1000212 [Entomophthora muscae]|uniref:Uncharacterized protein n=1 Tax=Entomophthora muscae TaxID=34485 RepID=A0ACC2U7W4_9FUNG|nr:hypothetical protein DSO57_1000212 [Entomophthora muscae]